MTDKDIIEALGYIQEHGICACTECPIFPCNDKCINTVTKLSFDLINYQQAEIERLEQLNQTQSTIIDELNKAFENIKTEAYKEFADMLKEIIISIDGLFEVCEIEEQIDNLLQELTERKEDWK